MDVLRLRSICKTYLTLEPSQYRKSGSSFSSSKPVAALSYCRQLGNALCSCSPCLSNPPKMCLSTAPRAWLLILPSKPSITFCNSLRK